MINSIILIMNIIILIIIIIFSYELSKILIIIIQLSQSLHNLSESVLNAIKENQKEHKE